MTPPNVAVRERGILFSGPMVRAILSGAKTQTRRVVREKIGPAPDGYYFDAYNGGPQWNWWTADNRVANSLPIVCCPFGKAGDRLWVRETWAEFTVTGHSALHGEQDADSIVFRADGELPKRISRWRPSIFMPRWASRLTLEVTGIRVERVQSIGYADAIAEGIEAHDDDGVTYYGPFGKGHADPCYEYRRLWDSLNKPRGYGWDANPYVWVISFRRVEP